MNADTIQVLMFAGITLAIILTPVLGYLVLVFCNWLGRKNILFTIVEEGQAKNIEFNGKFWRSVFSFRGHRFRGNYELTAEEIANPHQIVPPGKKRARSETLEEIRARINPHPYDIVRGENSSPRDRFLKFFRLGGLRFLGLPRLFTVKRSRFQWTSKEVKRSEEEGGKETKKINSGEIRTQYKTEEKMIGYVLVQEDVYYGQIDDAETAEGIPLQVILAITAAIVNPWRAQYAVQHWLEAVINQLEAAVREIVRGKDFQAALSITADTILPKIKLDERVLAEYGVDVRLIQVAEISPSGRQAEEYQRLITQRFEAERKAEAVRIAADAERHRLEQTSGYLATLPAEVVRWTAVQESNLTTLVINDGGTPTGTMVPVGGGSPPPTTPPATP